MNIFFVNQLWRTRAFAFVMMFSLVLSAFPASFFVAEAAVGENISVTVDPDDDPEYFILTYTGAHHWDLDGWTVEDAVATVFDLDDTTLNSGDSWKVCQNSGATTTCDQVESASPVWNNSGDTFTLKDPNGEVILTFDFGDVDDASDSKDLLPFYESNSKIDICHATESGTNPYNFISPNIQSFFNSGHDKDKDDIIPPFYYEDGEGIAYFAGTNWEGDYITLYRDECGDKKEEQKPVCEIGDNLLDNGSFEDPVADDKSAGGGHYELFASVPNWVIEKVSDSTLFTLEIWNNMFNGASDGDQNVELDGDGEPTMVSQTVTTIPNAVYELSFDFAARERTDANDNNVDALIDGVVLMNASGTETDWETYSKEFTADDNSTTVTLKDIGTPNGKGSLVDNAVLCLIEEPETFEVVAHKIVCTDEDEVPNKDDWGDLDPLDANSAQTWVDEHDSCELVPDWQFEWVADSEKFDPGDTATGTAGDPWNTFGPTDNDGKTSVTIDLDELGDDSKIWLREVLKDGYIPFTHGDTPNNTDDYSAAFFCNNDVLNYDNYEWINKVKADETYYCVAWNVPEEEPCEPERGVYADFVEDYDQGSTKGGDDVAVGRSNPDEATGDPDGTAGFYSLGMGGWITVGFDKYVVDVEGDDLSVHEVTNGSYPLEKVSVEVSQDGSTWYALSEEARNDANEGGDGVTLLDFSETGLSWIKYVRLTDTTDAGLHVNNADGFDLDTVDATYVVCDEPDDEPVMCEVTLYSDTTDFVVEEDANAVATWVHPNWTASIPGATWIWSTFFVDEPVEPETKTFLKQFGFEGNVTNATLYVAADNSYDADLNSSDAGEDAGGGNFAAADDYDVTGLINQGNNELSIAVNNHSGVSTAQGNPAGLLYKLHIEGEVTTDDDCEVPYVPEPVRECLIDGYKYDETGEPLEGWEIGLAGVPGEIQPVFEQLESPQALVPKVDPEPYVMDTDITDKDGYYCLNPKIKDKPLPVFDGPGESFPAFALPFFFDHVVFEVMQEGWENLKVEIDDDEEPTSSDSFFDIFVEVDLGEDMQVDFYNYEKDDELVCEPRKNLIENGDFEEPEVTDDAGWDIFDLPTFPSMAWAVEWLNVKPQSPDDAFLELHAGVNDWTPYEGEQYAELDSDWQGPGHNGNENASVLISQTIDTIPGEEYTLSWAFSPRPGKAWDENKLEVFVDGEEEASNQETGVGLDDTDWTTDSYTFTATGATTEIAFQDAGDGNSVGTFLDDVALYCDPNTELYKIEGYVWNDDDENGDWGEEGTLDDWTVKITNGDDDYSTTTDKDGYYYFLVPAGTWTITEKVKSGWEQTFPNDGSHEVTVPADLTLLDKVIEFIIPVAYADDDYDTFGDYNFGNNYVGEDDSRDGGGSGRSSGPSCRLFDTEQDGPDVKLIWETVRGSELSITANGTEIFSTTDDSVVDDGSYNTTVSEDTTFELTVTKGVKSDTCEEEVLYGGGGTGPGGDIAGVQTTKFPVGGVDAGAGGGSADTTNGLWLLALISLALVFKSRLTKSA